MPLTILQTKRYRGMGGWWLIQGPPTSDNPNYPTLTVVHNAEYLVVVEAELREMRTVGCGGWTEGPGQLHEIAYDFLMSIRLRPGLNPARLSHILGLTPLAHSRVGFDNVPLHPPGALHGHHPATAGGLLHRTP